MQIILYKQNMLSISSCTIHENSFLTHDASCHYGVSSQTINKYIQCLYMFQSQQPKLIQLLSLIEHFALQFSVALLAYWSVADRYCLLAAHIYSLWRDPQFAAKAEEKHSIKNIILLVFTK